jgi:hypothetical protein
MGNWNIIIQGTGPHHNNKPEIDANELAKEFVKKLIEQGQSIQGASFTSGSEEWLLPPELNTRCNPGELLRLYDQLSEPQ